ncbi:thermonuclease family protein [Bacillus ndiopicus]|uniref:thermonuclease family protein n=1 Tax=Bacillus ndiopicus TaxID=1347368 RepID=UPI0005AA33E3|nr:thermonuclease family protein [Bacillus ndiopicus]
MKPSDIKTLITSGTIILAVALYLIFSPDPKDKPVDENITTQQEENKIGQENEQQSAVAASISIQYAQQATGNKLQAVKYLSINDGDTFSIEMNGEKHKVRLLMVDTPEMNYDKGKPMPYAEDAKAFTENLLKNASKIELLFDVGPETDKYDRILAYIYVDDVLLQESLLKEGLAVMRYINKPNNTLEAELKEVQAEAQAQKLNVWAHEGYFDGKQFHEDAVH